MKLFKTLCILLSATMIVSTSAAQQKGDQAIGAGLSYITGDGYTSGGITVNYRYCLSDAFRLEPGFTFYFPNDRWSMWETGLNFHFLFKPDPYITLYPVLGLGITGAYYGGPTVASNDFSETSFAYSLGAGADYRIDDDKTVWMQYQFKISRFERSAISLGISFRW